MKKKILLASLLVLVLLSGALAGCFKKKTDVVSGPTTLTIYGLDDSDAFESIIAGFKERQPAVNVRYKKFADEQELENIVVNEIAEGEGPDVFYLSNMWLPRHIKKLVPLQSESLTPETFATAFVNVASQDLVQVDPRDGAKKIFALPLYVDTLALYYNKRHFEQYLPELGKPPATWQALKESAPKFRKETVDFALERGEVALGRGDNIKRASDILYNLFVQAGEAFYDSSFKEVRLGEGASDQFEFFLSFADSKNNHYSWSDSSTPPAEAGENLAEVEAFLSGKVSAIFGYSDLYGRLSNDIKNVKTRSDTVIDIEDVAVAPSPQFTDKQESHKVFAKYHALAVSRTSKKPILSWDFVQYATSQAASRSFHKKTGKPAARRDLIEEQKKEPITEVFVAQVGLAQSIPLFSESRFGQFLSEAITAANKGKSPSVSLKEAIAKMNALLKVEAPDGIYPKVKAVKK